MIVQRIYEVKTINCHRNDLDVVIIYKAYIMFKWKNKRLCYLKPMNKAAYEKLYPEKSFDCFKGYVVIERYNLLNLNIFTYVATGFLDGLKKVLNLKTKEKPQIDFL
jgi:hypothetical protein